MNKKLNTVLLIDDDKLTNLLHKKILEKIGSIKEIVIKESGQEALDYLSGKAADKQPLPDLIFLDINMPGMNGWEFLEEHKKLNASQPTELVVVMLTTSLNPSDKDKSSSFDQIVGFINKPLIGESLQNILDSNF